MPKTALFCIEHMHLGTLCEPWRLSETLLAKILNLSTQASKSSFTPTTNNEDKQERHRELLCTKQTFNNLTKIEL